MNKEIIKDWLNDIATPTGISYSEDRTISESMTEKIVDYVDKLEQQVKKQKEVIDKINEFVKELYDNTDDTTCYDIDKNIKEELLDILNEAD